jgi:hypothetical protein
MWEIFSTVHSFLSSFLNCTFYLHGDTLPYLHTLAHVAPFALGPTNQPVAELAS